MKYQHLKPSDRRWMEDFDRKAKQFHRFTPAQLQRRRDLQRVGATLQPPDPIRAAQQRTDSEDEAAEIAKRQFQRSTAPVEDEDERWERLPRFDPADPLPALLAHLELGRLVKLYGALAAHIATEGF
jgi:hypothetical protein